METKSIVIMSMDTKKQITDALCKQAYITMGALVTSHTSLDRRKDTRPVKFLLSFKVAFLELMDFRTQ